MVEIPAPAPLSGLPFEIALAQLDCVVGDIEGNAALLASALRQMSGARLVVASELALTGYPPEDLVLRPSVMRRVEDAVTRLAAATSGGAALLLGAPWREDGKLHNAALLVDGGELRGCCYKRLLPNYGVFDERRVFSAGGGATPLILDGNRLGVLICEDMWEPAGAFALKEQGAQALVSLNGSPYERGKAALRLAAARSRVRESGLPCLYVNQYGGQDELVFDGGSFFMDVEGRVVRQAPFWRPWVGMARGGLSEEATDVSCDDDDGLDYLALVTGLAGYVRKSGFRSVLVGLSGGIDSALTALLAVDALGASCVRCATLPSRYNSAQGMEDAEEVARRLGVALHTLPIEDLRRATRKALFPVADSAWRGVTGQNVQARLRGMLLMALSNASGALLLSAGNKSEAAVGYTTLYGDMCGGFAPLKDVYKTRVFRLAAWRNRFRPSQVKGAAGEVVPQRLLVKAPSAELAPGQRDEDDLPPYPRLDAILHALIEDNLSVAAAAARGFETSEVRRVWRMVLAAEYKRRQAAPGVKLTSCLLGRDRRYPIVNREREGEEGVVTAATS